MDLIKVKERITVKIDKNIMNSIIAELDKEINDLEIEILLDYIVTIKAKAINLQRFENFAYIRNIERFLIERKRQKL